MRISALTLAACATFSPVDAGRVSLRDASRSVLPLVALPSGAKDVQLLGNTVLVDSEGHLVAPSSVLRSVTPSLLVPTSRLGVLVPTRDEPDGIAIAAARAMKAVEILAIDERRNLAMLRVLGSLEKAQPIDPGRELGVGDELQLHGFGTPGVLPYVFRASVASILPSPSEGPGRIRYALDANATDASDGGVLFDRVSGKVHALTIFHLRHVHRVITKQADFEYGPTGTALGIPIGEVLEWMANARKAVSAPMAPAPTDPATATPTTTASGP